MQSKRKSNTVVTHALAGSVITFTVGEQSFNVDVGHLNTDVAQMAMIHGVIQKVSDRAAIGRDPETGASATPEEKFTAMKECADRLMSGGPWNATPIGGIGTAGGLLYRAMRNLYPNAWSDKTSFAAYVVTKAISESERLKKKVSENDVRAGLGRVKKIAAEMEKIRRAEMPDLGLDANGMLQELEGKA